MRVTTYSVAATVLVAAAMAIFWPGRNAAPGLAVVGAQAPGAAVDPFGAAPAATPPAADPFATPPGATPPADRATAAKSKANSAKSRASAASRIEAELQKTTTIDFVEMPLKDVVQYLSEVHNIPVVLKAKKMEEAAVSIDTPVTRSLRGINLGAVLDIMLEDLELTYYAGEVLFITTPEDAATRTEIRVYDCRDLLASPGRRASAAAGIATSPEAAPPSLVSGPAGVGFAPDHLQRAERLMAIVTTNVDFDAWQGHGGISLRNNKQLIKEGTGSVSEYDGLIVVTATAQTHKKVEHVLDMLREAAGLQPEMGKVVR